QHVNKVAETVCNSVGATPVVNPEGDVFPCCSSWVNFPEQRMGNVADRDVAVLMDLMREDPIAMFMHHQGPAVLLKYLRQKGCTVPPRCDGGAEVPVSGVSHALPDRYTHPCHLCGTLLENFSREAL